VHVLRAAPVEGRGVFLGGRGLQREGREGCGAAAGHVSVPPGCVLLLDGTRQTTGRQAGRQGRQGRAGGPHAGQAGQAGRMQGRQAGGPACRPTFVKWSTSWPTRPRPPKSQASESSTTRYLPGSGTGTCRQERVNGWVGGWASGWVGGWASGWVGGTQVGGGMSGEGGHAAVGQYACRAGRAGAPAGPRSP
jgi:hypothetical protein